MSDLKDVLNIRITPPNISDETMKEIAQFFMRTSIPRIIAERKKAAIEQKGIKKSS